MARGNPNFKVKKVAEEIAAEVVNEVAEVKLLTDESVLEAFATLQDVLKGMAAIKQAANKPHRHYSAIAQQMAMWERNFKKSLPSKRV